MDFLRTRSGLTTQTPSINDDRCEFDVHVAPEDIRTKYVSKRMPVRLTQNPVRYFNC